MNLNLFHPEWAEAIGWTLLHSLWQGMLIFVLTVPLLALLKKHPPQLRYLVLCLSMLALLITMAGTFYLYMPESLPGYSWMETAKSPAGSVSVPAIEQTASDRLAANPVTSYSIRATVSHFIQNYSAYLVNIWLFGACFFAFRWLGSFWLTYRLRSRGTCKVSPDWQQKMLRWSTELGIRRPVRLLESIQTEVPLVLGHLKPLVLLPVGTLNGLAPEQVEAIILHELAHIRRHDFMVNLLIAALEMILFYHPVYWWLCDQINREREQSCDDIAVAVCGNARLYAKTLLLMEEKRQQNALAMAYQGKKHQLLDRIKRICLTSPATYRPEYGKTGLSLALLLTVAVMSWANMPEKPNPSAAAEPVLFENTINPLPEAVSPQAIAVTAAAEHGAEPAVPEAETEPTAQISPSPIPPSSAADTIPYVPDIPAMGIEPKLPTAPAFPYTPEELAEALQDKQNGSDFLDKTIGSYNDKISSWQNQVRTEYLQSWKDRNNLIVEVFQSWKNNLDQYRRTDEIAFLVALKKGIRYFEDELKTHEKAIKKAENAVKGDLENYIKAFENTIKNHENRQKDHDSRMAVHDDRMRVHDLRMAVHDGRMDIHDSRMHLHDTRMKFHDERMKAHDVIMAAFEKEFFAALEADGLGKKSDKKLDFVVENGMVSVNGKMLNDQLAEKYRSLLKKYGYNPPKDGTFFFKISENNRSIGTSGGYSISRKEE